MKKIFSLVLAAILLSSTSFAAQISTRFLPVNIANGVAGLDGSVKIPVALLPSTVMEFQGVWNATTNVPALSNTGSSPTGIACNTSTNGNVYRVSVAGATNFGAGSISFQIGDFVICVGSQNTWVNSPAADGVTSVNGQQGAVVLTTDNIAQGVSPARFYWSQSLFDAAFAAKSTTNLSEGTNLYFTNARAEAAAVVNNMTTPNPFQAPSVSAVNNFVSGGYLPLTGGTLSGNLNVNANLSVAVPLADTNSLLIKKTWADGFQSITFDQTTENIIFNNTTGSGKLVFQGSQPGIDFGGNELTDLADGATPTSAATVEQLGAYLPLTGGTMSGNISMAGQSIDMGNGRIENLPIATNPSDAVSLSQLTASISNDGTLGGGSPSTTIAPSQSAVEVYVAAQIAAVNVLSSQKTFTLVSADITNQYVNMNVLCNANSMILAVKGAGGIIEGLDYTLSSVGGVTRITFAGDIATGGLDPLVVGDVLNAKCIY